MDSLSSRLETNNEQQSPAINMISEGVSHNEAITMPDKEDFKSNIPNTAADEVEATTSRGRAAAVSGQASASYVAGGDEDDEADDDDEDLTDDAPGSFNCPSNWDQDQDQEGFIDDNLSRVGSDYSTYSTSDTIKIFYTATANKTEPGAGTSASASEMPASYQQDQGGGGGGGGAMQREFKYSPQEMLLQPPSSSGFNFPAQPAQLHARHMQPPPHAYSVQQLPGTSHGHHQHAGHAHHHHGAPPPPAPQHSQHYPAAYMPGFHPNMWHPNAPYGTGGAGGYGGYGGYAPHRYAHYNAGYPHDNIMDMMQLSNSGREARNRAEKNRRDKLNGSIQELSTMVPHVAESPRRVDKTAVLRFAAHGMRLNYVFGNAEEQSRPQITDAVMKLLDSFFITLTCHGQIVLISSSIEQHLGHCQADLYGQNILHITHPDDHSMLKQRLIPTDLETLFQPDDETGEACPRTAAEEENIDRQLREDRRNFTVRLARAGPRSEPTAYEIVKIEGSFRRSDLAPRGVRTSTFPSSLQLIRRTRGRDDAIPLHTISGNDIVLVAIARIVRAPKIVNVMDTVGFLEYRTRHLIDGRIVDCEQRISLVAGYMTHEVRHLSPFTFMHQDDARWVIVALRQMYDRCSSYGESTYRLLTRNGKFIYLQSKGYLEINKETNEVESFVCTNSLLDEAVGKQNLFEMKKRFSIYINTQIPPQSSIDMPASENPLQLEKAVMCLIQNLRHSACDEDEKPELDADDTLNYARICGVSAHTPPQLMSDSMMRSYTLSHYNETSSACSSASRSTKTPPLTLVPPDASTVKTSISKSISVVNVTAARNLRGHQQRAAAVAAAAADAQAAAAAATAATSAHGCTCRLSDGVCEFCQQASASKQMPSAAPSTSAAVVQAGGMKRVHGSAAEDALAEDMKMPKLPFKSTEIKHVITSTLDQLGRTLDKQRSTVNVLRDQGDKFDVPNARQCIDEIMEEHQMQSEIYVNIRSEIESQLQNNPSGKIEDANADVDANAAANNTNTTKRNDSSMQQQTPQQTQQQQQQKPISDLELQP